jgi:L-asparaginase II
MHDYSPKKLLEFVRDGLVEQEHYGFFVKLNSKGDFFELGYSACYPFYLRSCAKPLQASLLIDYGVDEFYSFTSEEIAICCASHAGEPCHTELVQGILSKIGLEKEDLKCGIHAPLSVEEQNRLLLSGEKATTLHNNCSGKHAMMLSVCRKNGWDTANYYERKHPLQIAIKNKIYDLCELKEEFPITKDGCGVPICSMPLKNIVKGYSNLFFNPKYEKIKLAYQKNPYIIGGVNRYDTAIIEANNKLVAKVGAGGLCVVVNFEKKEVLLVKIMDCNMQARAICMTSALNQLNWLSDDDLNSEMIKAQSDKRIFTHHGDVVGNAEVTFSI